MFIAGEASGDLLAAELVAALRKTFAEAPSRPSADAQPLHTGLVPRFFGAGGPRMAAAGVELTFDMTQHSVIGLIEVLKSYGKFRRLFHQLLDLARERQPDVIVCVDFFGFNGRFARAIQQIVRARQGPFRNWNPRVIQYVSPQVWASRAGRARGLERDCDLLLSIFPFERDWYALRAPTLRVEFVGHPMVDRFKVQNSKLKAHGELPRVVLLPGSRAGELRRHLPVMLEAVRHIGSARSVSFKMILPDETLAELVRPLVASSPNLQIQTGGLADALAVADLAIASTGTVTMECAYFGVPTVALYKTSWSTYEIGKRLIQVGFLAMPNLLAGEELFPEFIQHRATPEKLARAALELIADEPRRAAIKARLAKVVASLGGPGASVRAARAIAKLLQPVIRRT